MPEQSLPQQPLPASPHGATRLALEATGLVKTYPLGRGKERLRALDGLSIEVAAGTVVAVLGPNGAGKSTTVRILTTLSRPDSGSASVCGLDVQRRPAAVRRLIGLVSQKSSSDPLATARENLVLAGRIQGMPAASARARAAELLARFDLEDAADRLAQKLSGGTARKLDVAIGLVHRPRVLFLDEPTTGLDPEARADMWAEIARLSAQDEMTVLLTTHYLEEADRLADRLAIVDQGRVVVEGTPDQLKSELRGDGLVVELGSADVVPSALAALSGVAGVHDARADGSTVRARADVAARAVPGVLTALDQAGVPVLSVAVQRPSLDDVYLRHVGRTFEVAA
ncbi:MAG TPA: ABC transporter ATP-binding protein [Actinomycetales bacterium]|nr:ABC transporter ATP-binding protein [Actinomycetales bacterium]